MTKPNYHDVLVKLLLVGDSGCGKSNMLLKYVDDMYMASFVSTIGIDFKIKTIEIEGKKVKLQIWDTAGQERFRTITTAYYRGAMGIMIVYSVTDEQSFKNVHSWIKNIMDHSNNNVKLLLVGNKIDCEQDRIITTARGNDLAVQYNANKPSTSPPLDFIEVSAKDGTNINSAFTNFTSKIVADILNNTKVDDSVKLFDNTKKSKPKKKSWCTLL